MAFIKKTKKGFTVNKGNSGETLATFSGKDAEKKAKTELSRLHKKNKPKASNRGKSAAKKDKKK